MHSVKTAYARKCYDSDKQTIDQTKQSIPKILSVNPTEYGKPRIELVNDSRPSIMRAIFPNQCHAGRFINLLRSSSVSSIVHVFANSPSNPNLLADMFQTYPGQVD